MKYLLYLLPIVLLIFYGRIKYNKEKEKKFKSNTINPPHGQDYKYKRNYILDIESPSAIDYQQSQNIALSSDFVQDNIWEKTLVK